MRKFYRLFLLALASLGLFACQPQRITETMAHSGDILFWDDFSGLEGGWERSSDEVGTLDYNGGGFRIWVNRPDYDLWTTPSRTFSDVRIEVDSAHIGGPDENRFGLICRYRDAENFYFFIISSDGYYAIGKVKEGLRTLLSQTMMAFNPAIVMGIAANHLRADCLADALMFYINGLPVAAVQDTDLVTGDVGLLAGAFDTPGVDVLFDNFVVIKP